MMSESRPICTSQGIDKCCNLGDIQHFSSIGAAGCQPRDGSRRVEYFLNFANYLPRFNRAKHLIPYIGQHFLCETPYRLWPAIGKDNVW